MSDKRAAQIAYWLRDNPTPAALKYVSYELEKLEFKGKLEISVTEEIDKVSESIGLAAAAIYDQSNMDEDRIRTTDVPTGKIPSAENQCPECGSTNLTQIKDEPQPLGPFWHDWW